MAPRFTFVLVHGAFTDASSWWPITLRLSGSGHRVFAPPVGLRSFADDCSYIQRFADRVAGPVILVGHGYGAAVASVAGAAPSVRGMVFVAGDALETGESIAELRALFPRSEVEDHLVATALRAESDEAGTEISVEVDRFAFLVAEGMAQDEAHVLAVSQRPLAQSALAERAPAIAWRQKPCWGVVAAADRAVHPDLQRYGYRRAHARRILELDGPHLLMRTHPAQITELLLTAMADIDDLS